MTRLTFHGGAGSVTGVNILVETDTQKFLFDCGLLQREDPHDSTNRKPFAYDVADVASLFVSHAHADHIGRIPKLVKEGFRGDIYSTPATKDLSSLMFDDALKIMRENEEPLFGATDVQKALSLWKVREYRSPFDVGDVSVEFLDAGHILGSSLVKVTRAGKVLMFTGDLGNSPEPLLRDTEVPKGVHYLIMESVYGDRVHEQRDERRARLRELIEETREKKRVLLIPSFSIERTQVLLHEINDMVEKGQMKPLPVYLDSPLAIRVTEVFKRYSHLLNDELRSHFESHDDPFSFSKLEISRTSESSERIHATANPKIIIAGSGMSMGGRIRGHERKYLPDPKATIAFPGYQVPGSLGRRILDGAKSVRIEGEEVKVRAQVALLSGYSGHRDRDGLIEFAEGGAETLQTVFVALGEMKSALFLSQRLHDFLGLNVQTAEPDVAYEIAW